MLVNVYFAPKNWDIFLLIWTKTVDVRLSKLLDNQFTRTTRLQVSHIKKNFLLKIFIAYIFYIICNLNLSHTYKLTKNDKHINFLCIPSLRRCSSYFPPRIFNPQLTSFQRRCSWNSTRILHAVKLPVSNLLSPGALRQVRPRTDSIPSWQCTRRSVPIYQRPGGGAVTHVTIYALADWCRGGSTGLNPV